VDPVTSLDLAWICLSVAVVCLAALAAALGAVFVLARRVSSLAVDVTEVGGTRPSCPDRPRIDQLEAFARGGPAGQPRGRHGARSQRPPPDPRARWDRAPEPQPDGLLAGPPPLIRRPPR
jgi:hypothetical protein